MTVVCRKLGREVVDLGPAVERRLSSELFLLQLSSRELDPFRMVLALFALCISGSVAVRGGLGGAMVPVDALLAAFGGPSRLRSVGSGVYGAILALTTSLLGPTDSLLCAFENVGYGRLVRDAPGDAVDALRSSSGTTDILREEVCESDV